MESYNTLSEAINAMKKQGYTEDFNLQKSHIGCKSKEIQLSHDDFHIDKQFRFDDNEDPGDQSVLYAISSEKYKLKGLLVNSVGIYSEGTVNEIIEKLK